jgi:FAD/FMN-containing dehydrogenase/Fe-S oxidoreductase
MLAASPMHPTTAQRALAAADCEIACDNLTRQLYATDASIYQVVPQAVAFPQSAAQAASVIRAAANAGISVTPRGAGTGLVGGAIGTGLVIDFARHNRAIDQLDLERRTVRVGAGVVLDQLNAFLKPHGFCFGPDVATSSRATLGGMIANNSSGARVPVYGVTADHVAGLQLVLADGRVETIAADGPGLQAQREQIGRLVQAHAGAIAERMPPGMPKHWPGYGLDRFLLHPGNLGSLLCGSEGTLAALVSAQLQIVPLPRQKALGLVFFASVTEAMQAGVELLDLQPAAIEHIDRLLLDQTRGQGAFAAARELLELDQHPCEAMLLVEFFEDTAGRLAQLAQRRFGLRHRLVTAPAEMDLVWNLRKAGLSLLQSCPGKSKPVEGIEDAAVRPQQLPAYVAGLQAVLGRLNLRASFYGHAASGLLHVRPVLDLANCGDLGKYRQLADEVAALVREFKGSLAAEHGLGMARTEFLEDQIGPELVGVMREIKAVFDPGNLFNPGKIVAQASPPVSVPTGVPPVEPNGSGSGRRLEPPFKIDTHLRFDSAGSAPLPFAPVLAFAARDGSFLANLEQCNGCGGCRKEVPTMCPTFQATGEEIMSTRGRANTIRAVLEGRGLAGTDPLRSAELEAALSHCLSCKACTNECPSNVNLTLLKAELVHARLSRDGLGLREWLVSKVDLLGQAGCLAPSLANAVLGWSATKHLLQSAVGFSARRTMPAYAQERFDRWFDARQKSATTAQPTRGRVILWDDTFVRYNEPHIGQAAVAVLEAAGFEVVLPRRRQCCGRPAFSQGNLDEATRLGRHNLALLAALEPAAPVLFLEPSCWSMFAEDYRELKLAGAAQVAPRCFLFEEFIEDLLRREPTALTFGERHEAVAIHAHCHTKALRNPELLTRLARRLPGRTVTLLQTGCCGMAGAFGMMESKYELSIGVAQPLKEQILQQPAGTLIVASGTSCRHQIADVTPARPRHMAEVLAAALA